MIILKAYNITVILKTDFISSVFDIFFYEVRSLTIIIFIKSFSLIKILFSLLINSITGPQQ